MAAKEPFEIPMGMRKVCWRFERWRKGHKARVPIPAALWTAAAVSHVAASCSFPVWSKLFQMPAQVMQDGPPPGGSRLDAGQQVGVGGLGL